MLQVAVITGDIITTCRSSIRCFARCRAWTPTSSISRICRVPARGARGLRCAGVLYAPARQVTDLGLAPGRNDTVRSVLESLGAPRPGIVVLHHSLLAFPGWSIWDEIVGLSDRSLAEYAHDEPIRCTIADPAHPICAGLSDWTLTDETYLMADAGGDNHILLTTDHPRSMRTLAWTRTFRQAACSACNRRRRARVG